MMPGMDGFEVCSKIKENSRTRDIPVIFLTAKTGIEDIIRGFEAGAVDYISKPFNPVELKVRVRNHLNLFHALRAVEKTNKEKDKFFSIIAHDLINPFHTILGFSELLVDEADVLPGETVVRYAGLIHESTKKTLGLLENLLNWARMQQGRIPFEPRQFQLCPVVAGETEVLKFTADGKNIQIINKVPENLQITADEKMVSTILRNLISNAIKFTPKNGEVNVSARVIPGAVEVSVSDTGMGMTSEAIENLFRIETSISTKGTENEKGTGLGLLLCNEFVHKHGGRMWVESTLGIGSKFYFTILSDIR
jgi:signal transduction histidine kinase